eukprot:m.99043 g.99043  ORF g.99043 m.99043 type:complete len:417 (-) comp27127_c1_seq1:59-1309(-)
MPKCSYVSPRNGKCSGQSEIGSTFCGGHRCPGCANPKPSKSGTCGNCDLYESPVDAAVVGDDYRASIVTAVEYEDINDYNDEGDYASLLPTHQTYGNAKESGENDNSMYTVSSEDLYASITAPLHTGDAPEFDAVANESNYYAVSYDASGAATLVLEEDDGSNLAHQLGQLAVDYNDTYDFSLPVVADVEANNYEVDQGKPTSQNRPHLPPRNQSTQQQSPVQTGSSLPRGWEEGRTQDGRVYYLDHNSKRTSWERPRSDALGNLVPQPQVGVYMPLPTGWELSLKPIPHFIDHNTKTTHLQDPRPLPSGWQQFVRKTDGVPFFVDTVNKRTQWDHPCSQQQSSAIEMQTDHSGRAYFINHNTRQTSWEDPRLQPGFFGLRGDGLPPGVERHFGPNNQVYYLDHRTKTSSWHPPTV